MFLKGYSCNWPDDSFVIKIVTAPQAYVIENLNDN